MAREYVPDQARKRFLSPRNTSVRVKYETPAGLTRERPEPETPCGEPGHWGGVCACTNYGAADAAE